MITITKVVKIEGLHFLLRKYQKNKKLITQNFPIKCNHILAVPQQP